MKRQRENRTQEKQEDAKQKTARRRLTKQHLRSFLLELLDPPSTFFNEFHRRHIPRQQMCVLSKHVVRLQPRKDLGYIGCGCFQSRERWIVCVIGELTTVERIDIEAEELQGEIGGFVADVAAHTERESRRVNFGGRRSSAAAPRAQCLDRVFARRLTHI